MKQMMASGDSYRFGTNKMQFSPQWLRLLSILRRWLCCFALFIVVPIVCGGSVFVSCFDMQYLVSFLFSQSS